MAAFAGLFALAGLALIVLAQFVNRTLVQEGYAKASLYMPNDRHWSKISAADAEVRSADAGLWGRCSYFGAPEKTPEPTPAPEPAEENT